MTTHFFENRTQYLRFKIAWSEAVNSPRAKSSLEPCDEWIGGSYGRVSKGTGVFRKTGWINAEHHILYNIIRGKPLECGFTPRPGWPNDGFDRGVFRLEYLIKMTNHVNATTHVKKTIDTFLEPFGETFTKEMFASVRIPEEIKEAA